MRIEPPRPVTSQPTTAELAANDADEAGRTERHTTASGLGIEDLSRGSGPELAAGMRARMHYVGTLSDGSVFDSSRDRGQPFEVEVGKGYLIKGFEEGVIGMRVGGLRRLVIPPELGYGSKPIGSKIPPDATLTFEIELLEIQ